MGVRHPYEIYYEQFNDFNSLESIKDFYNYCLKIKDNLLFL